jgi:replicative DNA helicase
MKKAVDLINAEGFGKFNMRKLGDHLGIAAKTVYNYYHSKDELYLTVIANGFQNLYDSCKSAYKSGETPLDKLIAMGRAYGPFKPPAPKRVVLVNVEDDLSDIWRRIYALAKVMDFTPAELKLLSENFIILPGRGKIGALMKIDAARNPVETDAALWLRKICAKYKPDLVVLDTKSRLFGLNENDNDHGSQWLNMLESVYRCAFMVLSHTGKANDKKNGYASRGASSISDNARSGMLLSILTDDDVKMYNIPDPEECFKLTLSKGNYSPGTKRAWFFRKMDEGIPEHISVEEVDVEAQKRDMVKFFQDHDIKKRDIDKKHNTDEIQPFKELFIQQYDSSQADFYKIIKSLLNSKILVVTEIKSESGQKSMFIKPFMINGCG